MEYKEIKTLKKQVEHCLREFPETRNSDIALTISVWQLFFPQFLFREGENSYSVPLKNLYELPREDNVKRIRAYFQNDKNLYLPTVWEIARKRGILEDEWRVAMGYPIKETTGTVAPSFTPPSENCPAKGAQGGGHAFREGDGWRTTCLYCGKAREEKKVEESVPPTLL